MALELTEVKNKDLQEVEVPKPCCQDKLHAKATNLDVEFATYAFVSWQFTSRLESKC